jgi:biopolymer transport protein ExbB
MRRPLAVVAAAFAVVLVPVLALGAGRLSSTGFGSVGGVAPEPGVMVLAQGAVPGTGASGAGAIPAAGTRASSALWELFVQSFDVFTILLVVGSVVGVAVIVSCVIDLRPGRILPRKTRDRVVDLATAGRWDDLKDLGARDGSFLAQVAAAAVMQRGKDKAAIRDAAELAAAEESGRYFRRLELLNVIGNLGPLVGLAGTVWGMILAFTSLGESGGQAGPADLSLGISKALFHTLLGLCLAIPCLLAFGLLRSMVDKACTRGIVIASHVVEKIPSSGK